MKKQSLARRTLKYLLSGVAGAAILLALALGVFRLLIGQIPEYQSELRAWVSQELDIDVRFDSLDARLGLTGPELTLRGVTMGSASEPFLQADGASVAVDTAALLLGARVEISRLTLDGVSLRIERSENGGFLLGEHRIAQGDSARIASLVPASVRVVIRDSELHYVDAIRDQDWLFSGFELGVESSEDRIDVDAALRSPSSLAQELRLDAEATITDSGAPRRWLVNLDADAFDLAELTRLLPVESPLTFGGSGSMSASAVIDAGSVQEVGLGIDLEEFGIGTTAVPVNSVYSRLALQAQLGRAGDSGWMIDLNDIQLVHEGSVWPAGTNARLRFDSDDAGLRAVGMSASFLRLQDLSPLEAVMAETPIAEQWAAHAPHGDLSELALELELERRNAPLSYQLETGFAGIVIDGVGELPGLAGLSGYLRAGNDSGTVQFTSNAVDVSWPLLFPDDVGIESLSGAVVWRRGRDELRVMSVDLGIGVSGNTANASFDLRIPGNGSSPTLGLDASLAAAELVPAKQFIPEPLMPASVYDWLDHAIVGGRGRNIQLTFYGPIADFPFDNGGGEFRVTADVEEAVLDYLDQWPLAEGLTGQIEFLNAGFAALGSGNVLGNQSDNVGVTIEDLREPLLSLTANTSGTLDGVVRFLREAPLVAQRLGPDFDRVAVTDGTGAVDLQLDLPLKQVDDFSLEAELSITEGALSVEGFGPPVTEIHGQLLATEETVTGNEIDAVFLGGPIVAAVSPGDQQGYRAEIRVDGEMTAESLAESFSLPHESLMAGQARWRGSLRLPALDPLTTQRTRISIESNLAGVALRFPEPLVKSPGDATSLGLELEFAAGGRVELSGNLGASRRFIMEFLSGDDGLEFTGGAIRFGGDAPSMPTRPGILVDGTVETLDLDAWVGLASESSLSQASPLFLGADVRIADFLAYGQRLGETALRVGRGETDWQIEIDSEAIAGTASVPRDAEQRGTIRARMERFYLARTDDGNLGELDPRNLPGISFAADQFGVGTRRFGSVMAEVATDPRGLVLSRFSSESGSYSMDMTGSWFRGAEGSRTSVEASMTSADVSAALRDIGLDPVVSGEAASLDASVYWDSAPGGDWLAHLNGVVGLSVGTGTLREIDPGAGRVVGLMSIAALPRRLALDFRDVFEDGFAFDEITGDFRLIDGNAYTDNLKLSGPAAEVGVVGRTGLRDRDYTQQIVVTSEPGNVLPTVAGLLGGPGAGAALFVFTRLFKEPLKGIGQVSYCLTGDWEQPTVEPIESDATDRAASCADLPEEMLSDIPRD